MAYVTLDGNGNITGMFANAQPAISGYAKIADADPRVATFASRGDGASLPAPVGERRRRDLRQCPPAPIEGMLIGITDSSTNAWGAVISGGGLFHVLGYYNGTNWTVAAK
jgi:hypothetical protein